MQSSDNAELENAGEPLTRPEPVVTRPYTQQPPPSSDSSKHTLASHGELHQESDSSTVFSVQQPSSEKDHDVEKEAPRTEEASRGPDPNLVTWSGPDDPECPKNWSKGKKWGATLVVSAFAFITPVSSSMVAPALNALGDELHMKSQVEIELTLSIFILAYAVGPLLFGPLSESFGRVRVTLWCNLFYIAWNLACGFAQNEAEIMVFRFLSGIGGSAPMAIGGGVLSDCWAPEERGKAVGIYSLAPLLGPVVGPIAGGFIAEKSTWRWVFWSTTIFASLVQVMGYFLLPESHHPTLLRRKKDRLKKETGNDLLHTDQDDGKSLFSTIGSAVARPSRMLATQPIVQVISLYMAYLFGLFYLLLSSFPSVWEDVYHESVGIGGLNYISLGVGYVVGAQVSAQVNDRIYMRLKNKRGNVGQPEFRIPPMFVGSVLIPAGLFWYGWSVQNRLHWMMPNVGISIFGAGAIVCLQSMQSYIIDSYSRFAASALAAAVVLRSVAAFGFPLFAPYMYEALDYGWGNSLLGFISIVIGIPSPYIFWIYGSKLRSMSKYAAG
ncbi:MFS general substrate transporter [Hypoxylon crocopeplum]|nr:MFS general substrate transporter [Hypoxylon crocopeplum]